MKRTKRGENGREREREWRKQQKEKVELESKQLKLLFPTHCGKKGQVPVHKLSVPHLNLTLQSANIAYEGSIKAIQNLCPKYDLTYVTPKLK